MDHLSIGIGIDDSGKIHKFVDLLYCIALLRFTLEGCPLGIETVNSSDSEAPGARLASGA